MLSKNCARAGPSAPGCRLGMSASTATKSNASMTTAIIRYRNLSALTECSDKWGPLPGKTQEFRPPPPDFKKALKTGYGHQTSAGLANLKELPRHPGHPRSPGT